MSDDILTSKFFKFRKNPDTQYDDTPNTSPYTQASSNNIESLSEGSEKFENDSEKRAINNKSSESNYTQVMVERWEKANKLSIPELDIKEIEEQGHFNHPLNGCPLN